MVDAVYGAAVFFRLGVMVLKGPCSVDDRKRPRHKMLVPGLLFRLTGFLPDKDKPGFFHDVPFLFHIALKNASHGETHETWPGLVFISRYSSVSLGMVQSKGMTAPATRSRPWPGSTSVT